MSSTSGLLSRDFGFISPSSRITSGCFGYLGSSGEVLYRVERTIGSKLGTTCSCLSRGVSFITFEISHTNGGGCSTPFGRRINREHGVFGRLVNSIRSLFISGTRRCERSYRGLCPYFGTLLGIVYECSRRFGGLGSRQGTCAFTSNRRFTLNLLVSGSGGKGVMHSRLTGRLGDGCCRVLISRCRSAGSIRSALFELLSGKSGHFVINSIGRDVCQFELTVPFVFARGGRGCGSCGGSTGNRDMGVVLSGGFHSHGRVYNFAGFLFSGFVSTTANRLSCGRSRCLGYNTSCPGHSLPYISLGVASKVGGSGVSRARTPRVTGLVLSGVGSGRRICSTGTGYAHSVYFNSFTILVHEKGNDVPRFTGVFSSCNVPYIDRGSNSLFRYDRIGVVVSLLHSISGPVRSVPLLTIVVSPVCNFAPSRLATVGVRNSGVGDSLCATIIGSGSRGIGDFLTSLRVLSRATMAVPITRFVEFIYRCGDVFTFTSTLKGTHRQVTGVGTFVSFTRRFSYSGDIKLASFVHLISGVRRDSSIVSTGPIYDGTRGTMAVVAIRRSGKLRFPIIVLTRYKHSCIFHRASKLVFGTGGKVTTGIRSSSLVYGRPSVPFALVGGVGHVSTLDRYLEILCITIAETGRRFVTFTDIRGLRGGVTGFTPNVTGKGVSPILYHECLDSNSFVVSTTVVRENKSILHRLDPIRVGIYSSSFSFGISLLRSRRTRSTTPRVVGPTPGRSVITRVRGSIDFGCNKVSCYGRPTGEGTSTLSTTRSSSPSLPVVLNGPTFVDAAKLSTTRQNATVRTFVRFYSFGSTTTSLSNRVSHLTGRDCLATRRTRTLSGGTLTTLFNNSLNEQLLSTSGICERLGLSSFLPLSGFVGHTSSRGILIHNVTSYVLRRGNGLILVSCGASGIGDRTRLLRECGGRVSFCHAITTGSLRGRIVRTKLCSFCLKGIYGCWRFWGGRLLF